MGKGKGPEKGRNLPKFRDGYAGINWGKKPLPTSLTIGPQHKKH